MPRLAATLALPVLLLASATATENYIDTATLLRDARIECAKIRMVGPKDYVICVDDVMMTADLGLVQVWEAVDESTLSVDLKLLRQARIACAAAPSTPKHISPSPDLTGTNFENCVEEVVHTNNVSAAALWLETEPRQLLQ